MVSTLREEQNREGKGIKAVYVYMCLCDFRVWFGGKRIQEEMVHLHGKLKISVFEARGLSGSGSQAYVKVSLGERRIFKSDLASVLPDGRFVWNVSVKVDVNDEVHV